jgi:hypothetical protein
MRRWQLATKEILVLVALIFCSTPSNAASENAYQEVFVEHLEMGPATNLDIKVHGKAAADIDRRLTEI